MEEVEVKRGRLIENKPSITTPCNARDEELIMRKSRVDLKSGEGLGNAILPDGRASMTYPVTGPAPSVLSDQ